MRQVRSCQANVSLEPIILDLVKQHCDSTSDYIRSLIMTDLKSKGLITAEIQLKIMLGDDYDAVLVQMKEMAEA